jgi:hypothetical protein
MEEILAGDSLARSVRALAVVVGCLALALLVQFGFYAYSFYRASTFPARYSTHSASNVESGRSAGGRDFDTLPAEEKIKRARGILVTKHQQEGGKLRAIVSEILKQPKDEPLRYAVGQEYPDLSRYDGDIGTFGDGDVVLFVNSSSYMSESYTYRDGRISGLQEMPLALFRSIATGKPVVADAAAAGTEPSGKFSALPPSSRYAAGVADSADRVMLQTATDAKGTSYTYWIPRETAEKSPKWRPESGEPPLSMVRAMSIAVDTWRRSHPGTGPAKVDSISLQGMNCYPGVPDRWFFMVHLTPTSARGISEGSWEVVLLNGNVVTPEIEPKTPDGGKPTS